MFRKNSINDWVFKYNEKVRFGQNEYLLAQISLRLISIPSCDINSRTISKWPLYAAIINAVELNAQKKFHK